MISTRAPSGGGDQCFVEAVAGLARAGEEQAFVGEAVGGGVDRLGRAEGGRDMGPAGALGRLRGVDPRVGHQLDRGAVGEADQARAEAGAVAADVLLADHRRDVAVPEVGGGVDIGRPQGDMGDAHGFTYEIPLV